MPKVTERVVLKEPTTYPNVSLKSKLTTKDLAKNRNRKIRSYQRVSRKTLAQRFAAAEKSGLRLQGAFPNNVTEQIDIKSVLQLIDAIVLDAFQTNPDVFTDGYGPDALFITPVQLKVYLVVIFLNRMRSVNSIDGEAVGTIPYLPSQAKIPFSFFNALSVMAPYGDIANLAMTYDNQFVISDEVIASNTYLQSDLSTPALASLLGVPSTLNGIHPLQVDPTTREVIIIQSTPVTATLSEYWEDSSPQVVSRIVSLIWGDQGVRDYSALPSLAVSADWYACGKGDGTASGRPGNLMFCPFPDYDEQHATVFCFFKRCDVKVLMNPKLALQPPARPSPDGSNWQFPQEYAVINYVRFPHYAKPDSNVYLGSKKYYSFHGRRVNPFPTYKKVSPEMLKQHCISVVSATQSQMRKAHDSMDGPGLPEAFNITAVRFWKECLFAMLTSLYRRVQDYCLIGSGLSKVALFRANYQTVLFGTVKMVAAQLAPVALGDSLILPWLDFENINPAHAFYNFEQSHTSMSAAGSLYSSPVGFTDPSADVDNNQIHFEDQIINAAWITAYTGLTGYRLVPGTSINTSRYYTKFVQAYTTASGLWLSDPPRDIGGVAMITYTKVGYDAERVVDLPIFDAEPANAPASPFTYLFELQELYYSDAVFGQLLYESIILPISNDMLNVDPEDISEFIYTAVVNRDPGGPTAIDKINNDIANENGQVQKTFAAIVAERHQMPATYEGVQFVQPSEIDDCFWDSVFNTISSIGSAAVNGTLAFATTGNLVESAAVALNTFIDGVSNNKSLFVGSPNDKKMLSYYKSMGPTHLAKNFEEVSHVSVRTVEPKLTQKRSVSAKPTTRAPSSAPSVPKGASKKNTKNDVNVSINTRSRQKTQPRKVKQVIPKTRPVSKSPSRVTNNTTTFTEKRT